MKGILIALIIFAVGCIENTTTNSNDGKDGGGGLSGAISRIAGPAGEKGDPGTPGKHGCKYDEHRHNPQQDCGVNTAIVADVFDKDGVKTGSELHYHNRNTVHTPENPHS